MIIYNVTTHIDDEVQEAWLQWMQETHIPEMLATGKFLAARMARVVEPDNPGGSTYAVQYTSPDRETLKRYYAEDAYRLREEASRRFADTIASFRTELEVISEHG